MPGLEQYAIAPGPSRSEFNTRQLTSEAPPRGRVWTPRRRLPRMDSLAYILGAPSIGSGPQTLSIIARGGRPKSRHKDVCGQCAGWERGLRGMRSRAENAQIGLLFNFCSWCGAALDGWTWARVELQPAKTLVHAGNEVGVRRLMYWPIYYQTLVKYTASLVAWSERRILQITALVFMRGTKSRAHKDATDITRFAWGVLRSVSQSQAREREATYKGKGRRSPAVRMSITISSQPHPTLSVFMAKREQESGAGVPNLASSVQPRVISPVVAEERTRNSRTDESRDSFGNLGTGSGVTDEKGIRRVWWHRTSVRWPDICGYPRSPGENLRVGPPPEQKQSCSIMQIHDGRIRLARLGGGGAQSRPPGSHTKCHHSAGSQGSGPGSRKFAPSKCGTRAGSRACKTEGHEKQLDECDRSSLGIFASSALWAQPRGRCSGDMMMQRPRGESPRKRRQSTGEGQSGIERGSGA
ncbi:hypothetical protein B0H17DRAFT_1144172 [Mycena rosella]|uniref:Uncharacterized protein n=1 Tax=Mycena rosella TaxID=1033263 RepID=A0AAD7CTP2_MYCRO|nr:hypothetical protein B0H17DRAFT_1144172 [Mycena rosella]